MSILGPHKKYALLLFLIMLLAALFEAVGLGLIIPFLSIILGDSTVAGGGKAILYVNDLFSRVVSEDNRVIGICAVILAVFIFKNIFIYLRSILTIHFYNLLRKYWSTTIMDKYIHVKYDYIISQKRGYLLNNLLNEPMLLSKFIGQLADYIARGVIAICIYSIMIIANWRVTLTLSLIIFLIMLIIWKWSTRFSIMVGKKRLGLNQEMTAEGEESLNGVRQVKLFALEDKVLKSFSRKYDELKKILVRHGIYRELPAPLGEIIIIYFLFSGLVYFEYVSDRSAATVLPMLTFLAITSQRLYQNVAVLVSGRMWLLSYVPSFKLINSIMHEKEIERENLSEGIIIKQLPGDIYFENITFSHGSSSTLFNNLTLSIPKNKITAIVGKSGSGKSTLVDLLCGLYKGYKGRIMIGDIELKEINLASWRKIIGFVSQDTFLFNTSIRDNILIGNSSAGEMDVIMASKLANAHEFIEALPQGYDTVLGDRGLTISGGQRQRITVARALIRMPEMLIFDEATSSLDTESEGLIQKSIEKIKNNKTLIVIAHRLSAIKNADLIYVLDKGQVVECGTYEELMGKGGIFYDMALQQS